MEKPKENSNSGSGRKNNNRRGGSSFPRSKPEFDQKILNIRRVTRVVAGGRRFSFSVALIAGDKKGAVGLGLGKAGDTALAINKALRNAKKNMIRLNLTKTMSIPHELSAKFSSSHISLRPNKGRGLVAGSVIRDIVKISGMKDITGKILSNSKNKLNNAKAVMSALSQISSKYTKIAAESPVVVVDNKEVPREQLEITN
ncbi:MAG: 30S ribosomal protein S5 [Candidatus Pacebacteria bacterium]|nr:30S ribosomal protein S5 [Candidatus Paceibacterota bacterium]